MYVKVHIGIYFWTYSHNKNQLMKNLQIKKNHAGKLSKSNYNWNGEENIITEISFWRKSDILFSNSPLRFEIHKHST